MKSRVFWCLLIPAYLGACAPANFDLGAPPPDEGVYSALFPYYVEDCAVSELRKKPGFGFEYSGGPGGHSVAFLNGACPEPDQHYPVLRLCPAGTPPDQAGTGISANSHFSNANWVAIPGRSLFFDGGLAPGAALTKAAYRQAQQRAESLDLYDGVAFYPEFFKDMPPGWTAHDWQYEISIATDYAIDFGRGRYCTRVPVSRAQMVQVIDYLNGRNALYRNGPLQYRWDVLEDNCSHLVHNALAAAGVWPAWPSHLPWLLAIFDFPVPRNEFVNLTRRTNDLKLTDIDALYADQAVRAAVLNDDFLPTEPGALAGAIPPRRPNEVYNTELSLIFYDEPTLGPYNRWFDQIFANPRDTDMAANLRHFQALYREVEDARQPLADLLSQRWYEPPARRADFAAFYTAYYRLIAHQAAAIQSALTHLHQSS